MNRQNLRIVIAVAIILAALSVLLAVRDQQNAAGLPSPPDPGLFHTATRLPPAEPGGKPIWEIRSPGKIFRIPQGLFRMGPVPTSVFSIQMVWPEWVPLRSGVAKSVKDGVHISVQLEPNKGQRTGKDLLNWRVAPGHYLPPMRLDEYPGYLIYPQKSFQDSGRLGAAYYESARPDGVTPEGDPILFHCAPGKGKDGGDWTPCRGFYRIFGDVLITVDFFGEHIKDGTGIYLKSIELLRSLAEVES